MPQKCFLAHFHYFCKGSKIFWLDCLSRIVILSSSNVQGVPRNLLHLSKMIMKIQFLIQSSFFYFLPVTMWFRLDVMGQKYCVYIGCSRIGPRVNARILISCRYGFHTDYSVSLLPIQKSCILLRSCGIIKTKILFLF